MLNILISKTNANAPILPIFEKWHNCAVDKYDFGLAPENFWKSSPASSMECETLIDAQRLLKIEKFQNGDEDKFSILPLTNNTSQSEQENFVTIGVGKDISAELAYRNVSQNTQFFGADPIFMDNYELYSKIGLYFPLAIAATDGYSAASVLLNNTYQHFDVFHIDLIYFIKNILKISTIENLWLDNEYAEYDLLPYFYKNGQLDQNGITICQFNIEIHSARNDKHFAKFKNFIQKIVEDRKYAILNHLLVGHHRIKFPEINHTSRGAVGGDSAALPRLATSRRRCQVSSNTWRRCHKKQQRCLRLKQNIDGFVGFHRRKLEDSTIKSRNVIEKFSVSRHSTTQPLITWQLLKNVGRDYDCDNLLKNKQSHAHRQHINLNRV
ncbi:unnamed protein product [Caenorhabditis angaria]|uniref:Methyltransferase FkbM domain-containing protein n=1 Tax=Caenorhabditis angaria TaxID=860376 RepID=A0A9P1J0T0_9PELO|nr:unnamed protein product [Caenorhabditis angaria]